MRALQSFGPFSWSKRFNFDTAMKRLVDGEVIYVGGSRREEVECNRHSKILIFLAYSKKKRIFVDKKVKEGVAEW